MLSKVDNRSGTYVVSGQGEKTGESQYHEGETRHAQPEEQLEIVTDGKYPEASSPRTPGSEQPESPKEHSLLKRVMRDPGEAGFRPTKRAAETAGGEYIRMAMSARKLSPSRNVVAGTSPGPLTSEHTATPPAA